MRSIQTGPLKNGTEFLDCITHKSPATIRFGKKCGTPSQEDPAFKSHGLRIPRINFQNISTFNQGNFAGNWNAEKPAPRPKREHSPGGEAFWI